MYFSIFFLVFASLNSFGADRTKSCRLTMPKHIIALKSKISFESTKKIIVKTDCPKKVQTKLLDLVAKSEGILSSKYGNHLFSNLDYHINLSPEKIHIHQLETLITKKIKEGMKKFVTSLSFNGPPLLGHSDNGSFELTIFPDANDKVFQASILITEKNKPTIQYWTSFQLGNLQKVLVAKSDVPSFYHIQMDNFETSWRPVVPNDIIVTEKKLIPYYRTIKEIKKGELLKYSMLNKITLVRPGDRIDVSFISSGIKIQTRALVRTAGGIGDSIQLMNPKTKKIFTATLTTKKNAIIDL